MAKHYVNNKKLLEHLIARRELVQKWKNGELKEKPRIDKYIGECIYLLATRIATRGNFSGYSYISEMIGDGIENCITYLDNFNPEKSSNPFGYFSLIITRAFIRRIDKEKKSQYIMYKYYQTHYDVEQMESGSDRVSSPEYIDTIVEQYEKKLIEKAKKL